MGEDVIRTAGEAIEAAAQIADKWAAENKAAAAKARRRESLDGIGGYMAPEMAEQLDGAAIECNAIAAAIRELAVRIPQFAR